MHKFSEIFSSPLSGLINIPKSEDKLLKSCLYHCIATTLLAVVVASTVSVYFLFEIFINPLMWALLVGTCIFPFKRSLTTVLRTAINDVNFTKRPLILEATLLPFNVLNSFAELLADIIIKRFKLFLFYFFGIPLIYSVYNFGILSKLFQFISTFYFMASDILALFGSKVVSITILTMIILLFTSIVFFKNCNIRILQVLGSSIWILIVLHLSNLAGNFALFIFTSSMIFFVIGGITEVLNIDIKNLTVSQLILFWEFICKPYKYSNKDDDSTNISEDEFLSDDESIRNSNLQSSKNSLTLNEDTEDKVPTSTNYMGDIKSSENLNSNSPKINFFIGTVYSIFDYCSGLISSIPKSDNAKNIRKSFMLNRRQSTRSPKKISNKSVVSQAFTFLLWSHIIVYSWSHYSITIIMIIALFMVALKKILIKLEIKNVIIWIFDRIKVRIDRMIGNRQHIFLPGFIRGSFKIFLQFDDKLRMMLSSGLDSLVSITLIAVLLLATIFLTIFLAFQVHNESLHLIELTGNVINSTMSSDLLSWLPEKKDIFSMVETLTHNVYVLGREWISKKTDQLFDTNAFNKARIEEQALELWEKLYQRILLKNNTNDTVLNHSHIGKIVLNRKSTMSSLNNQISGFWELLTSFDVLNFKKISDLIHENLGLLSTIVESLWVFIRSNINLVFSLGTGIFSIILGGGTVVLNFLLSTIIFLSALFYLLTYSESRYLPLQCISALTPNSENNPILQSIYLSVENGISAVFAVTFKMACFYGFYTSLTHYLFGVNLVVIPSIMAAILAAVPIVGTYWAAIPAITELVFINQDYIAASILLVLHLLPMYVIDTAIYSEIKETGHPYLTGLAIAGGVCWLGFQGVVLGPLLLCTLVIVLNLFKTLMSQYSVEVPLSDSNTKDKNKHKVTLKKSMSCDRSTSLLKDLSSAI